MPWAVDFLPSHIMELTNFVTSDELYTGSAATSRFAICPFLGIIPFCYSLLLITSHRSWGAWRRTSTGSACGWLHPPNQACRAPRGSARRADPSHGRRG